MKIKLVLILLVKLFAFNLEAQNTLIKDSVIKYLDTHKNLDPIESIWTLHVVRTLFTEKYSIEETQYMRSSWAVLREDGKRFQVIDIGGAEHETDATDFKAYFEATTIIGIYSYRCDFNHPAWIAKSKATLKDNFILEYSYFASMAYLKQTYKDEYEPGLKLRWKFTWTKEYPMPENRR
jgi:hypothetical protein